MQDAITDRNVGRAYLELPPWEDEGGKYYRVSPLAMMEHARRRIENDDGLDDFMKVDGSDEKGEYVIYGAMGDARNPDPGNGDFDQTQQEYRIGYGVKCYKDGTSVPFVRYNPEVGAGDDASASKIMSDVFPPFFQRTKEYLDNRHDKLDEAL